MSRAHDIYVVETNWPGGTQLDCKRFARYSVTAYNDRRDPSTRKWFDSVVGDFDKKNAGVCAVPERMGTGSDGWSQFKDMFVFSTFSAASACAARLAEHGELAAAKGDHGKSYEGPILTRVVHDVLVQTTIVVAEFGTKKRNE